MKFYTHLTEDERIFLDRGLQKGFSLRAIARDLGRSASSLSREIKRNAHWKWGYLPEDAQKRYKGRQKQKKSIIFNDQWLQTFVIEKLKGSSGIFGEGPWRILQAVRKERVVLREILEAETDSSEADLLIMILSLH